MSGNVKVEEARAAPSVRRRLVGHEHGLRYLLSRPGPFQAQPPDSRTLTGAAAAIETRRLAVSVPDAAQLILRQPLSPLSPVLNCG
jgi:hypothetical protein